MSTIKELIEGKELPVKITCEGLSSKWHMVTHANDKYCLTTDSNGNHNSWLLSSYNWELYEEPKKKVKVALYAYKYQSEKTYKVTFVMYRDNQHAVEALGPNCIVKRLDCSEIEVDYE